MNSSIDWAPLITSPFLWLLLGAAVFAFVMAKWRQMRDAWWRGALFLLLLLLVLNPRMMNEVRQGLNDKLVIVVDDSDSQKIGARDQTTEAALQHILQAAKDLPNVDPIVIRSSKDTQDVEGTNLFTALRNQIAAIPLPQVAGTIFITDGQVHDAPDDLGMFERLGPLHVVLTGKRDEFDRKVNIVSAPKYGLLNQTIDVTVKVEQAGGIAGSGVLLSVFQDGEKIEDVTVITGEEQNFSLTLKHPGQNVFEFSVPAEAGELTAINNSAPVIINGVRDRLKVLLVTGAPNMGERAWRNLLKSDPGIDLVHFTILRSPVAQDATPTRELSLIVFPVEELFAEKIADFDLIIFDKYQQHGLLMPYYFKNIEDYIRGGGAFLMAMGSDKLEGSIFETDLANALPVAPRNDKIMNQPYTPALTDAGKKHPVTADLFLQKNWGQWFTQVDIDAIRGETLLKGSNDRPLLVIDKVGDGRVAVLSSDNIWLWSKGGKSAGPYSELLRNTAHWLMKEPELEDDYIKADVKGNVITVSKRDIGDDVKTVQMRKPSGETEEVALTDKAQGWVLAKVTAEQHGIYSFEANGKKAFAVVGTATNPEFSDVLTTEAKMKPLVDKSGGGIIWFSDEPDLRLRQMSANAGQKAGDDWLGLRSNNAYAVDKVESNVLFPNWLFLLVVLLGALWVWRREGRAS